MSLLTIILSIVTCSQLTMRDGLSQNSVFSIAQDNDRNMWFATYDGINRYDGYNFTLYRTEKDPNFSHEAGADQRIYVDSQGGLWAYDGGLSKYDSKQDKFISLHDKVSGVVTSFQELPQGIMLVVVDGKIVQLDINTGDRLNVEPFYKGDEAFVIHSDHGILAVGTTTGSIITYRTEDLQLISSKTIYDKYQIKDVVVSANDQIWISFRPSLLVKYNINNGDLTDYSRKGGLPQGGSLMICRDRVNGVVAYLDKSIYKYDSTIDDFTFFYSLEDNPLAVKSIYQDLDGDIWLGSYYKGVYYCHQEDTPFENISLSVDAGDLQVCSIAESPEGTLWISALGKGVYTYDRTKGKITPFDRDITPNNTAGLHKIFFSQNGDIVWLGSDAGLSEYNRKTREFTQYTGMEYPRAVYSILQANENELWLGTLFGIYIFNTTTKEVRSVESTSNLFIYKLYEDSKGILWVASESGLYKSQIQRDSKGQVCCGIFIKETDAQDVHDILQWGGNLIIAARSGLYIRNEAGAWVHYDRTSGLSSSFVNSIEVDQFGVLWVGTEHGLNRFDPSTSEFSRHFKDKELVVDYYTKNAHCKSKDGGIYFGGIGGIIRIDPMRPKNRIHVSADPKITGFSVNGISRSLSDNKLSHKENSVRFTFAVTNFSSGHKNIFRYRLNGVDREWKITENPFTDAYGALRPGRYCLKVQSFNISGEEADQQAEFSFSITPPWYASGLAIGIYIILLVVLIIFIIDRIDSVNKKRAQEEIDRVREFTQAGIDRLTVLHYTNDPVSQEDAAFILKAVRTMENNISNEGYGVEQLADDLCMSRSNLYLKINKLTGESALRFVHKIRLEKACQLLCDTDKSIAEIAIETGFSSSAYFCTCFKREKGKTPNAWRQ